MLKRLIALLFLCSILAALPTFASDQPQQPAILQVQNNGTTVGTAANFFKINVTGCTASYATGTFTIACTGGGGGSSVTVAGGSTLTTANFNATTPVAQSNFINCTPQNSTTNVSIECPTGNSSTTFAAGNASVTVDGVACALGATCTVWGVHYAPIPSSDTLSAAGNFATTQSVSNAGLQVGSTIEVRAYGVYTTTTTSTPLFAPTVTAGGASNICSIAARTLTTSITNGYWDLDCFIQIQTTGSSGTAQAWGPSNSGTAAGALSAISSIGLYNNGITPSAFNTSTPETVTIRENAATVTGQTFQLLGLDIKVTY
jgi:hypothetical protein